MGGREARRLCPEAIVVPPRMAAYTQASKDLYAVFDDMTPLVEGLSIDEAFLDVRGMERDRRHPRRDRGAPAAARSASGSGCRSASGSLARSSSRRSRARSRSRTACSSCRPRASSTSCIRCRSSGSGASDHVTATQAARLRHRHGRRARPRRRARARRAARPGSGAPPARAGEQRRSPARAAAPPSPLDRLAASARAEAQIARGDRRRPGRARRPRHAPVTRIADASAGPWCFACASRTSRARRARTRFDTRPPQTQVVLAVARSLFAAARPLIDRRGLTLIGIAIANLDDDLPCQLSLPLERRRRRAARRRARRDPRPLRLDRDHPGRAPRPAPA